MKIIYTFLLLFDKKQRLQLSKELDVTQKTAWYMLHRLRLACGDKMTASLSGSVEIDELILVVERRISMLPRKHQGDKAVVVKRLFRNAGAGGKTKALFYRFYTDFISTIFACAHGFLNNIFHVV